MRVFFCKKKSGKWGGCFFVKKWTFPQRRVHYVGLQYQYFLHSTYLGVRTHPSHRLPTGLEQKLKSILPASLFHIGATNSTFVADP